MSMKSISFIQGRTFKFNGYFSRIKSAVSALFRIIFNFLPRSPKTKSRLEEHLSIILVEEKTEPMLKTPTMLSNKRMS